MPPAAAGVLHIAGSVNGTPELGEVSQSVEVAASVEQAQSQTATLGVMIDSSQINMMLSGRNPTYLALFKPGVSGPSLAGFKFGLAAGNGGISINGARTVDSVTTSDGAIATRTRGNAFSSIR